MWVFTELAGVELGRFESLFSWYFTACAHVHVPTWFPLDAARMSPFGLHFLSRLQRDLYNQVDVAHLSKKMLQGGQYQSE